MSEHLRSAAIYMLFLLLLLWTCYIGLFGRFLPWV